MTEITRRKILASGVALAIPIIGCVQRKKEWDVCEGACHLIDSKNIEHDPADFSQDVLRVQLEFTEFLKERQVSVGAYSYDGAGDDSIEDVRDGEELIASWDEEVTGYSAHFQADGADDASHLKIYIEEENDES